ncbi:MAG TPA: cadherin-like domain-containing protein, partial [Rubricoccaceae bacterium]
MTVTDAIASGGGTLGGTATATTNASGTATFTDLAIAGTVGDRTLSFSAAGLTGATSDTISLTAGAVVQLALTAPATAAAGTAESVTVRALDASGNVVTGYTGTVRFTSTDAAATLPADYTFTASDAGAKTLSVTFRTAGSPTLTVTDVDVAGLTDTETVAVSAGSPAQLAFTVQPSNVVAGAAISPAVQVTILDGFGNVVTGATDNVTVAIGTNPSGGTLSGTTTVAAVNGVATFSNLSVNLVGTGYTLTASSGSLTGATSAAFNVIAGPLDHFLVEAAGGGPIGNQLAGTPFNVRVTAQDAFNNTVTSFTGTVAFTSTPAGGITAGATSGAFTNGVLSSHAVTFSIPGSFTLTATRAGGSESGTSNSFEVQSPPTAVNEGPAANSAPGQPFHAFYSTAASPQTFTLAAPGVLANDNLGFPAATITSFGAATLGGSVTTYAAGSTVSPLPIEGFGGGGPIDGTSGALSVGADGTITFTPPNGFTGNYIFRYRLTNARGTSDAQVTIAVGVRPAAGADTYSPVLVGNVPVNTATSSQFSVSANDVGDGRVLAATGQTNGTVTLAQNGTFSFRPTVGYSGPAGFTYTVTNGYGTTAAATVSLTVGTPIWFVNAAANAGGDGRYDAPYNSLASFAAVNNGTGNNPAASDRLFLYTGTYTGPVTLLSGQGVIGQGATAALSTVAGVTWPADAGPEPAMNGTAPTVTATNATAVTLANVGSATTANNLLRGFNFGNVGATGTALAGTSFGTLAVSEVGITTNGRALNLTTGTLGGGFTTLSSSGGANNVLLSGVGTGGTVRTLGTTSDALSGATGDALTINGGDGSFTYAGTITNTTGLAVNVTGKTGGTLTFSGDINPATAGRGIAVTNTSATTVLFSGANQKISSGIQAGIDLSNNTGGTVAFTGNVAVTTTSGTGVSMGRTAAGSGPAVSFTGGLTIATTTGAAFAATGATTAGTPATSGGSVVVTGAANTIATSSGAASGRTLSIVNTTIGSGGLNFLSISSAGGTSGIVLNNTGTTAGLTVSGSGTTAGSGGTIRTSAGDAVSLTSTASPSLRYMILGEASAALGEAKSTTNAVGGNGISMTTVTNPVFRNLKIARTGGHGLVGTGVAGLTLADTDIFNAGDADNENGI